MAAVTLAYDSRLKRITCSIRLDHGDIIAYLYGCVNTFPREKQKNFAEARWKRVLGRRLDKRKYPGTVREWTAPGISDSYEAAARWRCRCGTTK